MPFAPRRRTRWLMFKTSVLTAALALTAVSQPASAQQPPNAGRQLQQIPPAAAPRNAAPEFRIERPTSATDTAEGGATVRVRSLQVTGATLFPEADLIAAAKVAPGSELTLSELRNAAARIAAYYNSRGYFLAQAYLPGAGRQGRTVVTIAVVEGRYGEIEVRNRARLSDRRRRAGSERPGQRRSRRERAARTAPAAAVRHSRRAGQIDADARRRRSARPTSSSTSTPAGGSPAASRPTMPATATPAPIALGGTINLNNPAGHRRPAQPARARLDRRARLRPRRPIRRRSASAHVGVAYTHLALRARAASSSCLDADGTRRHRQRLRQLSADPLARRQSLCPGRRRREAARGQDRRRLRRVRARRVTCGDARPRRRLARRSRRRRVERLLGRLGRRRSRHREPDRSGPPTR